MYGLKLSVGAAPVSRPHVSFLCSPGSVKYPVYYL